MQYQFKFSASYEIKKSPDGRYFTTIGGSPFVWDAQTGKKTVSFGQIKNPDSMCFSHSGKLLAVKNTSGKIALFDMDKLEHIESFQPAKSEGCGLMFTPDDRFIISADWDGKIYTLELCSGKTEIMKDEENLMHEHLFFDRYSDSFVFHSTEKGYHKGFRTVWKYPFEFNKPVTKSFDFYREFAYNGPNGGIAAVELRRKKVKVLERDFEHVIKEFDFEYHGKKKDIGKVVWSPDGKLIALTANTGEIQGEDIIYAVRVLEYDTLNVIAEYKLPYACFIEFTEDGQQFLVGSWKNGYCIKYEDIQKTEIETGMDLNALSRRIEADGLNADMMGEASEEELMRALYGVSDSAVWEAVNEGWCTEAQALDKVQPIYKYTYLIIKFVQETENGGLSQYIINSACELCEPLIKVFNELGLPRHAEIIEQALTLYNSGQEDMDHTDWNRLDEQCEALDENPSASLYAYLEKETKNI